MKRDDYWELFWLSGLPEAWMMSCRSRDGLNARALPPTEAGLPEEAEAPFRKKEERGTAELSGPPLTGE